MFREQALEFCRVTEQAAIASYPFIGKGKKELADDAAVNAMRKYLNKIDFSGEVVIGEGEIDNAPMLYIGEKVGNGTFEADIAVDPIDGTRMVATGQDNAVAVMVVAEKGSLLNAPDMYMEKIMVNKEGRGSIDLNLTVKENVINLAKKLNKDVSELKIMTLYKERHFETIKQLQDLGCSVVAVPDGDVEASVLVAVPDSDVDMYYGIGGAPEGVISAAILNATQGEMQARLLTRVMCKGESESNIEISKEELKRLDKLNLNTEQILNQDDLVKSDDLIVTMTGITNGTLLEGCKIKNNYATTETLLIRGKSQTMRFVKAKHRVE